MRYLLVTFCLILAACAKGGDSPATAAPSQLAGVWTSASGYVGTLTFTGSALTEVRQWLGGCTITATYAFSDSGSTVTTANVNVSYSNVTTCEAACQTYNGASCASSVADVLYFDGGIVGYTLSGSTLTLSKVGRSGFTFTKN